MEGASLPDFLVVSPSKSGTSWLFANLQGHPGILIPPQKEVRYFDAYWREHDIDWYCAQFSRHQGQLAGDVSPTYALLPAFAIKHISLLKPDLKIVLMLREPAARAWSHLRHTFRHHEANFAEHQGDIAELALEDMIRNLVHDFTLSCSDYESIVRRWSAHFPREQLHITFFEDAVARPEQYFASLLNFLGAAPFISLENVPLHRAIGRGLQFDLPKDLVPWLVRLYGPRRRRIERTLQRDFGMKAPWPAMSAHHGRTRLPALFDDWGIEILDGRFRAWRKSHDALSPVGLLRRLFAGHPAEFIGDLVDDLAPDIARSEMPLRRAGFSPEDRRLTRELDGVLPPDLD
jgi:hypothetical protein